MFQTKDSGSIPTSPLQLELRIIDNNKALTCYDKWHYLGNQKFIATVNYGVFINGNLWGCISYGVPSAKILKDYWTPKTQIGWFEIKRFAISDLLPKNSESRIIAISIKLLRKSFNVVGIVSYADTKMNHFGIIYKASGFQYCGLTAKKTDYHLENGKILQRGKPTQFIGEWKARSQKHLFIKIFKNIKGERADWTPKP